MARKRLLKAQKEELLDLWQGIKTGVAKSQHYKTRMIKLYNEIHRTGYKYTTNCHSCLASIFGYMKSEVEKLQENDKE